MAVKPWRAPLFEGKQTLGPVLGALQYDIQVRLQPQTLGQGQEVADAHNLMTVEVSDAHNLENIGLRHTEIELDELYRRAMPLS